MSLDTSLSAGEEAYIASRGQNATPANERRYSNEHLASVFDKTEAIAKKMGALGFEEVMPAFRTSRR